ncbi:MAG: GTP cyclohydrolase FolE2 [Deltaproteobacteria bacterium]|jgi:GTP cyclohydrolase I|nr:GTP cyclohydrolase FolE2 [Deltaproteobacteria bacterium]
MQDIQNSPAEVSIPIDRVGINNLQLPLIVSDKTNGRQHTVATVDLGVDLPASFKGTHMSRFVEALENWNEELSYQSFKTLLMDVRKRLDARKAYAHFRFNYFVRKASPVSGSHGLMGYECSFTGQAEPGPQGSDRFDLCLGVNVPLMTVCPCSKAISREGAHSQRAVLRILLRQKGFAWIEEFIELAESAGSSPVYPLLKREDEKYVTEHSFANPRFVEDVVRSAAQSLEQHPHVSWFRVEVESLESIHAHNAFAVIEKHCSST